MTMWGVRGSIPTPEAENLGFGGNTACVELLLPNGDLFILDAGSGIRGLGLRMHEIGAKHPNRKVHIFLTHYHWDHIQGLPFFPPLYNPNEEILFYATRYSQTIQTLIAGLSNPYFPINFVAAPCKKDLFDLDEGPMNISGAVVHTFPLNHPQGAGGYRIEVGGTTIVYAPDREHGDGKLDAVIREYSQGADILIHDSQYTPEEYPKYRGWGHSTWEEAASVARDSGIKKLVLFHHDPGHRDDFMRKLGQEAQRGFANVVVAQEGQSLTF
jgi:phosphoribosyl 1,2-cyclic phosphodiesterase